MARDGRRSADVVIRLATVDDLFRAPEPQLFSATGRLISGMEELILTLHGRRVPKRLRITIALAEGAPEQDQEALAELVHRYSDLRLQELELRMRVQGRQQRRALLVGGLLFVLGVAFAGEFTASFWPDEIRNLLGDGIFLVVAWVGLWYPLDYLAFGRQPLLQERKVLSALSRAEVRLLRERAGTTAGQRPAEALQGPTGAGRRAGSR